jgi:hypothetical protein
LFISANCIHLRSELRTYIINDKGAIAGPDHAMDALRYLCLGVPRYAEIRARVEKKAKIKSLNFSGIK